MKTTRAAMIIAHPGHELRVHHWLETARPEVLVLTDGSGRTNESRLGSTIKVLQRAAGHYQHVIRAKEHLRPLAQAMWHFATH